MTLNIEVVKIKLFQAFLYSCVSAAKKQWKMFQLNICLKIKVSIEKLREKN